MKDIFLDANFPRTASKRVYHLGVRAGEVANRLITVGHPSRAAAIAAHLDPDPKPFKLESDRGFVTFTGRYHGVPLSVISIGMGMANMDFLCRETRETVDGDMVIVRLGSCGGLLDLPVGSVVVPRASVAVTRNLDFDFSNSEEDRSFESHTDPPYRISKFVFPDAQLHEALYAELEAARPRAFAAALSKDGVNASTDSFYSSQGRITSFPDHNTNLIRHLTNTIEDLATLEMETFHLFHLSSCWRPSLGHSVHPLLSPVAPGHAPAVVSASPATSLSVKQAGTSHPSQISTRMRVASVHMIFASRSSQEVITPPEVAELEAWTGEAILRALVNFPVPTENLHEEVGSVWAL